MSTISEEGLDTDQTSEIFFGELDRIVDDLVTKDITTIKLDELLILVIKVSGAVHQSQKKITKTFAQQLEDARDYHLNRSLEAYRGRTVMVISAASGGLHMLSAMANVAPSKALGSAGFVNSKAGANIFEVTHLSTQTAEGTSKTIEYFTKTLSSTAQASGSAQSIYQLQQQGVTTESQSKSEANKILKQETDQESTQEGNRTDEAKRALQQYEESRHRTFQTVAGG